MKKYVFIHFDAIPEGKTFNQLTDNEVMAIAMADELPSFTYDSFEEFIADFNSEMSPNDNFYYGRTIEM